jgi:hypothetical protein
MLEIDVATEESYDEDRSKFVVTDSYRVQLEHSLVSASKWEARWEKAFLGKEDKTQEETLSYVKLMILNDNLPPGVFQKLVENHLEQVQTYISAPMTATKLRNDPNSAQSRETITTELIYYWMISLNVPVQFERWHLNRLITLIRVINFKNSPKKKMSAAERKALNRQRLAKHKTRG